MDARRRNEGRGGATNRMVDGEPGHVHGGQVLWAGCHSGRNPTWFHCGGWVPRGEDHPHWNRVRSNPEVGHWESYDRHEGSLVPRELPRYTGRAKHPACDEGQVAAGRSSYMGRQFEGGRRRDGTPSSTTRGGCSKEGRAVERREGRKNEEEEKGIQEGQRKVRRQEGKEGPSSLLRDEGRPGEGSRSSRGCQQFRVQQQSQRKEVQGEGKEESPRFVWMHGIGPSEKDESKSSQEDSKEDQEDSEIVNEFIREEFDKYIQQQRRGDLRRAGSPSGGCWIPTFESVGVGGKRAQLGHHSKVGACPPGTGATGITPGNQCSSKGANGRLESSEPSTPVMGFLSKVRKRRAEKRRVSAERESQRERQRKGEEQQGGGEDREEVRRRDDEETASRKILSALEEKSGKEMGEKISSVAVCEELSGLDGSEVALRRAACKEPEMQQPAIGAVVDCVRHRTALREKELGSLEGLCFGECVLWLVLGLSDHHDELCKTLPTGDEVFPLPLDTPWTLSEVQVAPLNVQRILFGLICGLNSLNGQGIRWEGPLSETRKRILLNLLGEARKFDEFDRCVRFGETSWTKFLKVRSIDYKGDEVQVAQYTSWSNLAPALPDEIGTVRLEDVMEGGARHYALNFEEFLVPEDAQEYTRPPRVMIADEDWREVCQGLLDKGVCGLLAASKVYQVKGKALLNGLFGVSKNDAVNGIEIHRLIMNLIPLNRLCRSFEGDVGTLPAWPSMAPLCLQPTEDLLVSSEDVKCFFYIFATPEAWQPFMAFNKVVPPELCEGASEPMYLCAKVLPMGFRNSVSLAQHIHRWVVSQSMRNEAGELTGMGGHAEHRRHRPFTGCNPSYRIYLDNYDELEKVDKSFAKMIAGTPSVHTLALRDTYRGLNIPRHPKKAVEREFVAEVQGALVDGRTGTARPKPDKVAKYVGLAWELIKSGRATQKQLQVVAGGLVYMTMFRRPLLGSLNAIWELIESFNQSPSQLKREMPLEVKRELLRFCCLVPLARMDFRTPMTGCVTASDASTTGGGVTASSGVTEWGCIAANSKVRGDVVEEPDLITVLTVGLFDGISALRVGADAVGLPVAGHISVEPHVPSKRVVESHFPSSVFVDRVENVDSEMVLQWSCQFSQVGLVILGAGPPCQGVSGLNADRKGALKDKRSNLFEHVERIYLLLKKHFPWAQVHKLMESVASMDEKDRIIMSRGVGITPWKIDSSGLTLCRRPRLYWISWELLLGPGVDLEPKEGEGWSEVQQASLSIDINPKLFLTPGWNLVGERLPTFTTSRPRATPGRRPAGIDGCTEEEIKRWQEDEHRFPPYQYRTQNCLVNNMGELRVPNVQEREVMMGFPLDYTRNCVPKAAQGTTGHLDERLSLIGNSWNVFVISWLLFSLGHTLGLVDKMDLKEVAKQCCPGGGLMLAGVLLRPFLDRCRRPGEVKTPELTLSQKLGGLVSMKGEDLLLQAQSEDTVRHHRLRASLPARLWKWRTICGWRWSSSGEHINSLEMRAVHTALRWRVMKQKLIKSRFIHMVDSLVCLHSLTRGRSSSKKLRRTLLRINALILASSCQPVWAYVHTSQNPADRPSRKPVRKRWVK